MEPEIIVNDQGAFEKHYKFTGDGKPIYWLPQPPLEVEVATPRRVQTSEESDEPVMTTRQVPLTDEHGDQMSYEVTEPIYDEETGEIIGEQGTGRFLLLWTTEEVQAVDGNGDPLYWHTVEDIDIRYEPQPPLEITEDDERYTEGLERAYELVPLPDEEPSELPLTPEQKRLKVLEDVQNSIKAELESVDEKANMTSTDLQAFMDYIFSNE